MSCDREKNGQDKTEDERGQWATKKMIFGFSIFHEINQNFKQLCYLDYLVRRNLYLLMKQLNQSATSKGLMYRRGMHGVYILQVYIPKAYQVV